MDSLNIGREVFEREIAVLERVREHLGNTFVSILNEIMRCKGKVVLIGMGKSGHVAKKIACETFVTRKITLAAARIAQGKQDRLYLGNLSSLRDWGYAKDYVECMWLILQNDRPEDFVIATGVQHSVREFCALAFHYAGIELEFKGEGLEEKGYDRASGRVLVEVFEDFYRPTDVVNLLGNPAKAKRELGWNPQKTAFEELVELMVKHDMEQVAVERAEEHIRMNLAEYLERGVVK